MNFRLPIRLRLTLWFFSIFAVATLALLSACLWMVHRSILELETNELQQRVRSVQRFLEARQPDETLSAKQQALAVYDVMHGGKWLQVIDQDSNWLYRSKYVAAVYPALSLPQQLGSSRYSFQYASGDLNVRAMIATIAVHGRGYTVQTGLTLNKTLVILGDFRKQLMILTPLVLLLAAAAGYFMSRKALAPVAAITAEARSIGDGNLAFVLLQGSNGSNRDEVAGVITHGKHKFQRSVKQDQVRHALLLSNSYVDVKPSPKLLGLLVEAFFD